MGSPYCHCPREIVTELILPYLDEMGEEQVRRIAQTEEHQICEHCRKEIERITVVPEASRYDCDSVHGTQLDS